MSSSSSNAALDTEALTRALRLSEREFATLRHLIETTLGIQISDAKRLMLETRIARRMRELSLPTISEYCERLTAAGTSQLELQHFFDAGGDLVLRKILLLQAKGNIVRDTHMREQSI